MIKKIALITDGGMSAGFITTFHQPCLATFKDMLNVAREAFQISSRKKLKVKEKRKKFYHMLLCYPYQGNLLWVYHTGSRTLTVFLMYQKWKQSRWSQLAASHSYWNITCLLAQAIWKMSRFLKIFQLVPMHPILAKLRYGVRIQELKIPSTLMLLNCLWFLRNVLSSQK